jgi:hypothetical protein
LRLILFQFSEDRKIVPNLVLRRAQLINMEQDCLYKLGEEAMWDKARVTRCVCKKIAQNVAKSLFVKMITYVTFTAENSSNYWWYILVQSSPKITQSEQLLNRRKIAQSGHPEHGSRQITL